MWVASYWPFCVPCRLYEISTPSGVNSLIVTDVVFSLSSPRNSSSGMVSKTSSTCAPHGVRQVIRLSAGGNPKTQRSPRARRSVDALGSPRDAQVGSDLLETVDDFRIERDASLSKPLHPCETLLAMNVDPILTLCSRTVFQLARKPVHVPPELVERPERGRIEGHEEVSNIRFLLVRVDLQSRRRSAQHAAEDVDHEREAISLVTAELLAFAAERQQASAESLRESIQHPGGIR